MVAGLMVFGTDGDNSSWAAAESICHRDSRRWTPTLVLCWGRFRCSLCGCLGAVICEAAKGRTSGGKDQWRSVQMHSGRAPSSITALSQECVCMCVWLYMQTHVCLTQERLRAQKNFLIINSQFLHLFSACVCVRVCVYFLRCQQWIWDAAAFRFASCIFTKTTNLPLVSLTG